MKTYDLRALGRSVWQHGIKLAAASLLVLPLLGPAMAQDDVDAACAEAGIYDYDSCNAYLSGGSEPAYEEPTYEEPAYEEPAYEEPAYEEPAYEEPAYEEPAYEEPAYEEPAYEEPAYEEPAYEEPAYEEPAYEEPAYEEPTFDEPVYEDEPVVEEPTYDEPAIEPQDNAEDPIVDEDVYEDETVTDGDATAEDIGDDSNDPVAAEDEAGSDEDLTATDEPLVLEDDAGDARLFTTEEAEAFDAEPLIDENGVQAEVIEDLPDDVDPSEISPALDSVKEYGSNAVPEEPEFVPTDDYEAQLFDAPEAVDPVEGEDYSMLETARTSFDAPEGVTVIDNSENTYIYEVNNTTIINNYYEDQQRLAYGSDSVEYYDYADGSYSESIIADDGSQVITIRDRYGNIISRTYYDAYGNEYVLAWYDPSFREDERMYWSDIGYDLPPLLVTVPRGDYIFFYDKRDQAALRRFFQLPPVEPVRRLYTIDEVKRSARLRDSLPRVEIADLTFANGSARINRNQARTLEKLAQAMLASIEANPGETFLVEGHTDAPGSEQENLRLSDARAVAVARALTEYFGVPPWNLTTQGYGERYLKVQTNASNANNRRVTIRRITPLVTTASR